MKRRFLIVLLCLVTVSAIAQNTRRKKKPAAKPVTQQNANNPVSKPAVDSTRKPAVAAAPAKPFNRPLDGYYKKANITLSKPMPYANLRESDVAYVKRVWREIDVREKMNQFLASPKQRLIDIIMDAVAAGELTAYDATPDSKNDPDGDAFYKPLTSAQAKAQMADSILVDKFDKNTGEKIGSTMQPGEFNPDSIIKFRIKEDWVFDRQRSIFEPRIIGIAPMKKQKLNGPVSGLNIDYQPAFWIRFPDLRPVLATKEAVNRSNDNTGLSYDDIFLKRIFTSYIVKVSNDKDLRIKDYKDGADRLVESERIKKDLMDWELNLWQY